MATDNACVDLLRALRDNRIVLPLNETRSQDLDEIVGRVVSGWDPPRGVCDEPRAGVTRYP